MKTILTGKWVFDSHLLVYILDADSPFYFAAQKVFSLIPEGKIQPVVAQQNLLEAENVLVRFGKISLNESHRAISDLIKNFQFALIHPMSTTYAIYDRILNENKEENKIDLFDYYLAATLIDNRVPRLLTLNTRDFSAIKNFQAINPF